MREIKCEQCGKTFTTEAPNSKYCSLDCREIARRAKRLEWESKNEGYNCTYARLRRKKEKSHAY